MISVIVPCYNDYGWLFNTCLPSLRDQTYKDFEVIVVDDGSDTIPEELFPYFPFVRLIKQEHKGGGIARNIGLKEAKGEFVIFPDTDCLLVPECLGKMIKVLATSPGLTFVYSYFYMVNKDGWIDMFHSYKFKKELLEQVNFVSACTLSKRVPEMIWDEELKRFQDWELWLRLSRHGYKGKLLEEELFFHFLRKDSVTNIQEDYKKSQVEMFNKLNLKIGSDGVICGQKIL